MIFADNLSVGCGDTSGISRNKALDSEFVKGASDFIVSLGSWPGHGSSFLREGVFLHELGHNLGLRNGGTDHRPNKPNYLSVMNPSFELMGLYHAGNVYFDYSRVVLPTLNENYLYELKGLGPLALNQGIIWYCNGALHTTLNGSAPIDWNCSGSIDLAARASDINADMAKSTLTNQNDWLKISFKGGGFIGASITSMASIQPLTHDAPGERSEL